MISTVNNFKAFGLLETSSGLQKLDIFASNNFLLAFYNVQYIVQRNGNKPNLQRVKNIHFHELSSVVFKLFPTEIYTLVLHILILFYSKTFIARIGFLF